MSATYGCSRVPSSVNCVTIASTSKVSPPSATSISLAAVARSRTSCANTGMSRTMPTRNPTRRALSAYAGPMPFNVVPIFASPNLDSCSASSIWCHGKMSCAKLETINLLHEIPRVSSESISLNSVGKSTTTPLPMTGVTCEYSTPLGISCSAYR